VFGSPIHLELLSHVGTARGILVRLRFYVCLVDCRRQDMLNLECVW
jgi:hypothetical protein